MSPKYHITNTPVRNPILDEPCLNPQQFYNSRTQETIETRCGSRFSNECPSCALRYQIEERAILEAGQPAPPQNTSLPKPCAVFLTLTMGSFGLIHNHAPKFPNQYRYGAQIITSHCETELIRAFNMSLHRATTDWKKAGFNISYRGSREIQERGAGHYHLIVTVALEDETTYRNSTLTSEPTAEELAKRLKNLNLGSTNTPQELISLSTSKTVSKRRTQVGLPAPSTSTLRLPAKITFGKQTDIQVLNLYSDTSTDPNSFGRKASYLSKALTYLVKDMARTMPGINSMPNRKHLQRLANESFALLSDRFVTESFSVWITRHIANEQKRLLQTGLEQGTLLQKIKDRIQDAASLTNPIHPTCATLRHLFQIQQTISTITEWKFLSQFTPKDFPVFNKSGEPTPRSEKFKRFSPHMFAYEITAGTIAQALKNHPETLAFLKHALTYKTEGEHILTDLGRTLHRSILLKIRKLVTSHGHTGTCTVSSRWAVTKTVLRKKYQQRELTRLHTEYRAAQKNYSVTTDQISRAQAHNELNQTRQLLKAALEKQARAKATKLEHKIEQKRHKRIKLQATFEKICATNQTSRSKILIVQQEINTAIASINKLEEKVRHLRHGCGAHIWIRINKLRT